MGCPWGADPERTSPRRSMLESVIGAGEEARAVATVRHRSPGEDAVAGDALRIRFQPALINHP